MALPTEAERLRGELDAAKATIAEQAARLEAWEGLRTKIESVKSTLIKTFHMVVPLYSSTREALTEISEVIDAMPPKPKTTPPKGEQDA